MEYMRRKIKAYQLEDTPFIVIDVLQKEGDCPNRFDEKHRYECSLDCGNSFLLFTYDFMNDVIEGEGALNRGTWSYDLETLVKVGFVPRIMGFDDFMEERAADISCCKSDLGEQLSYKGELIGNKPVCEFSNAVRIITADPEIRQYQDLIRKNPKKIMGECGIRFYKNGKLTVVTTASEENILRRGKSPNTNIE
ncbi:MAG: hypothetical protein NT129_00215 [Candidatus Aenigmarchaeota archaeon]|nr:hypothetical protein [Candidatus Aenigmarchaeota archaeon]